LAVKRYDDGTCSVWLHERRVGDPVTITPPSGNLHLHDPDRDAAFLATGTGLTPMLAMLDQYLREGSGQAVLLFGERTEADLMYRATLDRLSAGHANLTAAYVLSQPSADWAGSTGYIQDHLGTALADLEQPHVYACGVPEMVVETEAQLQDRGISADAIFTEGWEQGAVAD
jgi:ferredoxin-NADP reductase